MLTPERTWETPRLLARPPVVADAQVIFDRYASDPEVAKYMTWKPHRSVDETKEFLEWCQRAWHVGSAFPWSLWLKHSQAFAGLVEMRIGAHGVDVGYALSRRCWHQGLMTEALSSVVHRALAQPGIFRVWATCDVDNVASARVLERVGMQREGVLRQWLVHPNLGETPRDALCYSIVKANSTALPSNRRR